MINKWVFDDETLALEKLFGNISKQTNVDGRLLVLAGAGRFTGAYIVMYASSNGIDSKNYTAFDWFSTFVDE